MLTKLSKENFSKEVLESNEKVLVDFMRIGVRLVRC